MGATSSSSSGGGGGGQGLGFGGAEDVERELEDALNKVGYSRGGAVWREERNDAFKDGTYNWKARENTRLSPWKTVSLFHSSCTNVVPFADSFS